MLRVTDKKLLLATRFDKAMMAVRFPRVVGTATTVVTSTTATPTVNLPTCKKGDLLLVFMRSNSSLTGITRPGLATGWSLLSDFSSPDASDDMAALWVKEADGTEGSTVTSVTLTTGTARLYTFIAVAVRGGAWELLEDQPAIVSQGGSGTAADPPSATPYWGKQRYLWIAFVSYEDNITVTAPPSNYSGLVTCNLSGTASGASACTVAMAWRQLEASTENPGTFTGSGSNNKMNCVVSIGPKYPRLATFQSTRGSASD